MTTNGWPQVQLGEVLTHYKEHIERPEPREYPKLSVKLYGRGVVLDAPADGSSLKMQRHQIARAGQVILSEIWGKKGAIGFVPEDGDGALCTSHFFLFDVKEDRVERGWLHALFRANYLAEQLDSQAFGTTGYAAVRPKALLTAKIPLPPLAEQRRIVAKLDHLAAKIDEARRLRIDAVERRRALQQAALDHLLPHDGETVQLGNLIADGSRVSYGVLVPGPDVEDGVPFVRVQDLDVHNPPPKPAKRISRQIESQYSRTRLRGGEVLVAVVGSIGKVGIAPMTWRDANVARAVCRIEPNYNVDSGFLAAVLQSSKAQQYFAAVTRTLAQPTLNVGQLIRLPVPLVSQESQRRIVAHLDALQAQVDQLKKLQEQTSKELDALLPSLLDKAFKGEL